MLGDHLQLLSLAGGAKDLVRELTLNARQQAECRKSSEQYARHMRSEPHAAHKKQASRFGAQKEHSRDITTDAAPFTCTALQASDLVERNSLMQAYTYITLSDVENVDMQT